MSKKAKRKHHKDTTPEDPALREDAVVHAEEYQRDEEHQSEANTEHTVARGHTDTAAAVRAAVDTAAALVGAARVAHTALTQGKKKGGGKTAKRADRAIKAAEGVVEAAAALVDLNRAAPEALTALKHIGPKRARKIVEARPFTSIEEVRALLPKKAFEEVKDKLRT